MFVISIVSNRRRRHEIDVITGTSDGEVFFWNLTTRDLMNKVCVHSSPLCGVGFVLSGDRVATISEDGNMIVTDLSVLHSVSALFEDVIYYCLNLGCHHIY